MMRFFSRQWHSSESQDAQDRVVRKYYDSHLPSVLPKLSPPFRQLALGVTADNSTLDLHDALIRHITVDHQAASLEVALRIGDQQVGYSDFDIKYSEVEGLAGLQGELSRIVHDQDTELLYDEVDITTQGQSVHRILFWPYQEIEVVFEEMTWTQAPTKGREFERPADPIFVK